MTQHIFLANIATDIADQAKEVGKTFGVEGSLFVAQVISFSIVAYLLYNFAYKPVLGILEERRQRIAEGLANAERIKAELAKTEAARQEIFQKANLEANKLIEEARNAATRVLEAVCSDVGLLDRSSDPSGMVRVSVRKACHP